MNTCNQSTLEKLPDEILLEVCKYLLCNDILHSFVGLNHRMTQMITQFRHHVSLHRISISKYHYLRINVFPQIGSQIRTLSIDRCYSVLQDELFFEHFGDKMPMIFPRLERISLMSYRHKHLLAFLSTLHDLDYLVEIRLYSLFSVERLHQSTAIRSLFQANNHRLTTIFIDNKSSPLNVDDSHRYSNVLRLSIKLEKTTDLPSLFAAVPNVQYLDVIIEGADSLNEAFDDMEFSSLFHLTDFRLKSINRIWWNLEELFILFIHLPIVRYLSLFLSTLNKRLVDGNIMLASLPSTVQKFNYAIHLLHVTIPDQAEITAASWPPSHPVACILRDNILFIHTLPYHLTHILSFSIVGKMVTDHPNSEIGYDRLVEQIQLSVDKNLTFSKSLGVISQCRRVREIAIYIQANDEVVKEEQAAVARSAKLPRLNQIGIFGPIPDDLNHFSLILNAAPNLFRLDLPFNYLLKLFEDQHISHLLEQRITALCIYGNDPKSSSITVNERHMPIIVSALSRLNDLYIELTHLPSSATTVSKKDNLDDTNASDQLCQQQKYEVISPGSSESMLICLLKEFKEHRLIALCLDGQFIEEIKTHTEQWLRNNTILCEQQFKAVFDSGRNRLLIWM